MKKLLLSLFALFLVGGLALNLFPSLEAWLHQFLGWH